MSGTKNNILYTIGHSKHAIRYFIDLLKRYKINIVADVRSVPYSRYCPQFDKDVISAALQEVNIQYMFLGSELGARPDNPACYKDGCADFKLITRSEGFDNGLQHLLTDIRKYCIVLMCAEKEPLDCHRTILICRNLKKHKICIKHILEDGRIEDHQDTERRLVKTLKIEPTLFEQGRMQSDLIEQAYDQQSRKISHRPEEPRKLYERAR